DPLSPMMNYDLAWWFQIARRNDESIAQFHKTLQLDPNYAAAHHWLGWSLLWRGEMEAAIAEFLKAKALDDLSLFDGSLGYAYAVTGNRAKAEQILRELEGLSTRRYVSPRPRVFVYMGLGDKDKALDWLENGYN